MRQVEADPAAAGCAIVDPAGLHHIQPPGGPSGAGGAAGAHCTFYATIRLTDLCTLYEWRHGVMSALCCVTGSIYRWLGIDEHTRFPPWVISGMS